MKKMLFVLTISKKKFEFSKNLQFSKDLQKNNTKVIVIDKKKMASHKSIISVENFIPTSISTSYEQIELSIKSAPAQLQKFYRQKHSCDVIVKFYGYEFQLHKSVIEKSSTLMKQKLWPKINDKWIAQLSNIKIKQKLKISQQQLQKMISLIYGFSITVRRCQVQQLYLFAKNFQLQQIQNIIHNDMITRFDEYELFPLMKMAHNQQLNEVLQLCYDQLEIEMYEPLRYSKSGSFLLDEQLFKTVIKRHNWQKTTNEKFGLSKTQIVSLIEEYCFVNGLSKQKEYKIIEQIEDKENIRYHISFNQVLRKQSTPRKVKSSSEIFFRNTLTLPRDKEEKDKYNRRLSPFIKNHFNLDHENSQVNKQYSPCVMLTPGQVSKSQKSQYTKSISNYSTDNRSQKNNRSRRESVGSIETLNDPRIIHKITEITQSQQEIKYAHIDMRVRTENLMKKVKQQQARGKMNKEKMKRMESNLQEITAEIKCSKVKLNQLTQTVNNVETLKNKKQTLSKFNSLFEKDIALDLTLSTSFGMRTQVNKACKI